MFCFFLATLRFEGLVGAVAFDGFIKINQIAVKVRSIDAGNFVSPPTVTRQQPHIPVPSIMRGHMLIMQGMSYFLAMRVANFIMGRGPMAKI